MDDIIIIIMVFNGFKNIYFYFFLTMRTYYYLYIVISRFIVRGFRLYEKNYFKYFYYESELYLKYLRKSCKIKKKL